MIRALRLGLRLAVSGGRDALVRLVFTAVGVGVGLALLLLAMAGPATMSGRFERSAWQHAGVATFQPDYPNDDPVVEAPDGALFLVVSDFYDGRPITRAYVAALGPHTAVPPGLDRLPGPGEVALSPAMRRLLASTPDDELDDRFPGRDSLTIGPAGLAHDLELVAIIGRTPDQLRAVHSVVTEVHGFYRESVPSGAFGLVGFQEFFFNVGALFLLIPVVILIVVVSRVAWRQRERRLAAVRLVGATRTQIALAAAAETGLAAVLGSLLGWGGYELGRRVVAATFVFQGGHFWLDDLTVPARMLLIVLLGAPLLVVVTAVLSMRRVQGSPLAVQRQVPRRRPSAWSALPFVVGVGGQAALVPFADDLQRAATEGDGSDAGLSTFAVLGGLLTLSTIVGFVLIGPWLVMAVGRAVARFSRRVPALLAARRIAADPYATFRSVSAVVLATTAISYLGSAASTPTDFTGTPQHRPGVVHAVTGGVATQQIAPLLAEPSVLPVYGAGPWVVRCADLASVRYNITCPYPGPDQSPYLEPAPGVSYAGIFELYFRTDGSLAAENRLRTRITALVPNAIITSERDPSLDTLVTALDDLDSLFSVVALFVLILAAFGLAASMISGLIERRRPFALLRASGVHLGELRRTVLLETTATMLVTSAFGAGVGLLLAYIATEQTTATWRWPSLTVYVLEGAGVLAALAFSMLALPLLNPTTRHDAVRFE